MQKPLTMLRISGQMHDNRSDGRQPYCVNPGRRGAGKAPKCNKLVVDCHVGELIKRKKSVRAHKLPRAFVRWPLGPRTEAVRAAEGNRGTPLAG
jgi:hypothetical protein